MSLKFLNEDTGDLKDVVFCFTGKSTKPRREMSATAIWAGASVTTSITKYTTILVIADANSISAKATKARSLGLDLISPEQFFAMCDQPQHPTGKDNISQFHIKKQEPTIEQEQKKNRHSLVRRIKL